MLRGGVEEKMYKIKKVLWIENFYVVMNFKVFIFLNFRNKCIIVEKNSFNV